MVDQTTCPLYENPIIVESTVTTPVVKFFSAFENRVYEF